MKADSAVSKKSLDFALRITKAYKYIVENSQEYVLSKLRSASGHILTGNVIELI